MRSLIAGIGSAVSAAASSACCWIPLVGLGAGFSAAGAAAFFEQYRWWFLAAAIVSLGFGFFFHYRRDTACPPGGACEGTLPMTKRLHRGMLWVSTACVAAFAFFPSYVGVLFGAQSQPTTATAAESVRVLPISGMTCEGCEAALEQALSKVPGVLRVDARYVEGDAILTFADGQVPHERALSAAVAALGYSIGEPKPAAVSEASAVDAPARLAGQWRAVFPDDELGEIVVVLDIGWLPSGRWISQFDIPTIDLENYPVDVSIEGDDVVLEFSAIRSVVVVQLTPDGRVLEGVARTGGEEEPARYERVADEPAFSEMFLKLENAADDPDAVQPLSSDGAELREAFNRDRDKVRLLMLLAPS